MKMQALYRVTMAGLMLLTGALSGRAQSLTGELTVKVPFDFSVGERELPAGDYVIKRYSDSPNLLIIQRADRSVTVAVYTSPLRTSEGQAETRLTFNEYGGRRFLARVRSRFGVFSHELAKTQAERKLAGISSARSL